MASPYDAYLAYQRARERGLGKTEASIAAQGGNPNAAPEAATRGTFDAGAHQQAYEAGPGAPAKQALDAGNLAALRDAQKLAQGLEEQTAAGAAGDRARALRAYAGRGDAKKAAAIRKINAGASRTAGLNTAQIMQTAQGQANQREDNYQNRVMQMQQTAQLIAQRQQEAERAREEARRIDPLKLITQIGGMSLGGGGQGTMAGLAIAQLKDMFGGGASDAAAVEHLKQQEVARRAREEEESRRGWGPTYGGGLGGFQR